MFLPKDMLSLNKRAFSDRVNFQKQESSVKLSRTKPLISVLRIPASENYSNPMNLESDRIPKDQTNGDYTSYGNDNRSSPA